MEKRKIAGLVPWLPWPLSRWRAWTEPVPAQRLAALRIGLSLCLLLDILTTYGPHVHDFYGPDSLSRVGQRDVFGYVGRGGNYGTDDRDMASWYWSLWRGFNHPVTFGAALTGWIVLTFWIILRLRERQGWDVRSAAPLDGRGTPVSWAWLTGGWMAASAVGIVGFWASATTLPDAVTYDLETALQFWSAVFVLGAATLFVILSHFRPDPDGARLRLLLAAWALSGVFAVVACWQLITDQLARPDLALNLDWLLEPWDQNPAALRLAVVAWGITTLLLLIGCWTRVAAILTWLLMTSFDNLNHYNVDSGETVRYVLLFYVLFTPCAAVWSVDSWRRKDSDSRPIYVPPWPLRLMLVQLIFIYFMNGVYKLSGDTWAEGTSLYYVLSSLEIARFPLSQLPVNFLLLQISSYVVLVWETSFPLLMLFRWTRIPALIMGASFHVGIFVTMEIGFFAPYMLCFYLPMVPWERWFQRRARRASAPAPAQAATVNGQQSSVPAKTAARP